MSSLSFFCNDTDGELEVRFDPADAAAPPDVATFNQALADSGFGSLHIFQHALTDFINACRNASAELTVPIGQRRDGEFSLKVAADLMSARLTLIPPQGGRAVADAVRAALHQQGIVHGILGDRLDAALAAGVCEDLIIAIGNAPRAGSAARFEALLAYKDRELSHVDETATIQYRDLGHLLLVEPGDRLMQRLPAVQGTNGTDIRGHTLLAKPLPDPPFDKNLQGAAPAPGDPNLLLATVVGQPVPMAHGVIVHSVIEVPNVDLSTGHIVYGGTIRISGDVKAGMQLDVTGDVFVGGMIEAAQITAGGNVAVKGGIVGHGDTHLGGNVLPPSTARIICKGSLQALFMESAHVEAGGSILIDGAARQCELMAGNEILGGKKRPEHSQIVGGRALATHRIKVATLGSPTGIQTRVQVGFDPHLGLALHAKEQLYQHALTEFDQVLQLITYFDKHPHKDVGGIGAKTEATRVRLLDEIASLREELAQLAEEIVAVEHARIEVGKEMYEGVEVHIGKQVWHVLDETGPGTLQLQHGKITVGK